MGMTKNHLCAVPLVAALLLAGCATPQLQQPQIAIPAVFKEAVVTAPDGSRWQQGRPAEQQPRGQWWAVFNEPALNQLIADATRANASLAVAMARVKQARAIAGIVQANRVPQIGAGLGVDRSRALPGAPSAQPVTLYQANLTASYELDLFGGVRAGVDAARADAAASEASYNSVLLALQADVAQSYFRLRAIDAELATLERTASLWEESVRVNQRRVELGDASDFDLSRARTELSTVRAEAMSVRRLRAASEHALAVLLGVPAASFTAPVQALPEGVALPAIPAGMPSALLERRPDIAAAQRTMVAANARIGVARAAMFPALTINAAGGGVAGAFSDVFKWSSRSWVLGALMSVPVIDGGRNRANVTRSEAVLEESVASYRQSVLLAFAEVEDQLAGLRTLEQQAAHIEQARMSARRSAELAQKLYAAGSGNYLNLLDAQRTLADVERRAVQLRGNRAATTVALIRALGGGWEKS